MEAKFSCFISVYLLDQMWNVVESDLVYLSGFCQLKRQEGRDLLTHVPGSPKHDSSDVTGFRGLNNVISPLFPSLICLPGVGFPAR